MRESQALNLTVNPSYQIQRQIPSTQKVLKLARFRQIQVAFQSLSLYSCYSHYGFLVMFTYFELVTRDLINKVPLVNSKHIFSVNDLVPCMNVMTSTIILAVKLVTPPLLSPSLAPAPQHAEKEASRGKNKFFLARWFGFGSK